MLIVSACRAVIIVIILTISVIFAVLIVRNIAKSKRQDQFMTHIKKPQDILIEALRYREEEEEERGRMRPRKPTAPQPPDRIIQPTTIIRNSW
jgi:hypothetical protein